MLCKCAAEEEAVGFAPGSILVTHPAPNDDDGESVAAEAGEDAPKVAVDDAVVTEPVEVEGK